MPLEFLISALVTLLVVVDPIGLVPAFLGITDGLSDRLRRQVALRACLIAGAILIGAALIGDWLLRQLGITLSAFRIAGGLLLFAVAFEMVLGLRLQRDAKDAEQAVEEHLHDMAAFPLAIPHHRGHPTGRSGRLPAPMAGSAARCRRHGHGGKPGVFLRRRTHRQAARRYRQRGAVAAARRHSGGAGGAICRRWRPHGIRDLIEFKARTRPRA